MTTRRELLSWMSLGSLAGVTAGLARPARAQHEGHEAQPPPAPARDQTPPESSPAAESRTAQGYVPVRTLNGWTLTIEH